MKEYRISIRMKNFDTTTEYYKTMKKCLKVLKEELLLLYYIQDEILAIEIDTLENYIITNVKVLKGKEFTIS